MIEGLLPKPLISQRSVPRQSLFELKNENNHWKWERTDVVANCSCYLNVCYPAQNRALINFHNFSMILFLRNQETNDIFIKLSYDLKCSTTLHYLPINITLLTPLYILHIIMKHEPWLPFPLSFEVPVIWSPPFPLPNMSFEVPPKKCHIDNVT